MQPFHRSGAASATLAVREFLFFQQRGFTVATFRTSQGWETQAEPKPVKPSWTA